MRSPKIQTRLRRQVRRFIAEHNLVEKGQPLLVGVSGGADSLCMVHILLQLKDDLGCNLHIAHLNHGLRGEESDADADYVFDLAQELKIPAIVQKRNVRLYQAEKGISLEEAAREVRYAFFGEVAVTIGASAVAVGHTADDQAETILMHLIRGTGLSGLAGMHPLSQWHLADSAFLKVIRPLLEITREETQSYCNACDLSPRADSSNLSPDYLRNRIRMDLIPILEDYNPNIRESLLRSARTVIDDMAYLSQGVASLWGTVANEIESGITLQNSAFKALSPSLQRHLLRSALERLLGSPRDIHEVYIENLLDVMQKPAGKRLSLLGGLVFHGDYIQSLITKENKSLCPLPVLEHEHRLLVPGETLFSGWRVKLEISNRQSGTSSLESMPRIQKGKIYRALFDFDVSGADLTVRTRRDGDRFQPLGMNEFKKLQDFMIDSKIPRVWRGRVPLVCSEDRILWVVGWQIGEQAKITSSTRRVLSIEFATGNVLNGK